MVLSISLMVAEFTHTIHTHTHTHTHTYMVLLLFPFTIGETCIWRVK